jgi:cyclophilin family peptidyl-prolyl cis-trans isomerase
MRDATLQQPMISHLRIPRARRAEFLNGRHVVFGKVVDGVDLLKKVANQYGTDNGVPSAELFIAGCGALN